MRGYAPIRPTDLPRLLAERFRDIERRLQILERPTGSQKAMTSQRAREAETAAATALSEVATERDRNDSQWRSIDANRDAIATERRRNDSQWTVIDSKASQSSVSSLTSRVSSVESKVNSSASSTEVQQLSMRLSDALDRIRVLQSRVRALENNTSPTDPWW